jgi:hypothetical protein
MQVIMWQEIAWDNPWRQNVWAIIVRPGLNFSALLLFCIDLVLIISMFLWRSDSIGGWTLGISDHIEGGLERAKGADDGRKLQRHGWLDYETG